MHPALILSSRAAVCGSVAIQRAALNGPPGSPRFARDDDTPKPSGDRALGVTLYRTACAMSRNNAAGSVPPDTARIGALSSLPSQTPITVLSTQPMNQASR